MSFTTYRNELNEKLQAPEAQEATHYGTLAVLLETWGEGVTAVVQPSRVINCGAPDIAIKRGPAPLGYVECKNVGANLDEIEQSDQLSRYRDSLPNLILTDYLQFRWYVEGELRAEARLGRLDREGKVRTTKDGIAQVQELLSCFLRQEPPIAASASELARYMAGAARMIHDMTLQTLQKEDKSGSLPGMLQAFRDTLIPDLEPDQFADMYAQTIAYGLFSARYNVPTGTEFTREHAAFDLPKTNPFLRDLFSQIAGIDLDESIVWIVDDLADLLNRAQMDQIADDFARRPGREDPVVHFYEDFLREYDPKEKKLRGVFYTPEPVVKYIVRSIDYLLKEKFDKPLGLADEDVYILDPACGTGTFLYFVIDQIYHNVCAHLGQGAWKSYVQERLLGRVFGFELLMAPYTIAHMKLSIQLRDLGYDFSGEERLGIYLTNSLEEAIELAEGQLRLGIERTIAEESEAAGDIKRTKPIMVVLGTHIEQLMDRYKEAVRGERNIQPLSDDYIKFIRFAHDRIERTGYGIVGMITNHAYLSGLIHRGMREELMKTFPEIYVLDLHGNVRIGETTPEGGKDENVFDIQQGVAISLLSRLPTGETPAPPISTSAAETHSNSGAGVPAINYTHTGGAGVPAINYTHTGGAGVPPINYTHTGGAGVPPASASFLPITRDLVRSRRRLPHWERGGAVYFITFRTKGTQLSETERQVVVDACLYWHETKWHIYAVVVMPDHVHLLVRPLPIVQKWSGETPSQPAGETPAPPISTPAAETHSNSGAGVPPINYTHTGGAGVPAINYTHTGGAGVPAINYTHTGGAGVPAINYTHTGGEPYGWTNALTALFVTKQNSMRSCITC